MSISLYILVCCVCLFAYVSTSITCGFDPKLIIIGTITLVALYVILGIIIDPLLQNLPHTEVQIQTEKQSS